MSRSHTRYALSYRSSNRGRLPRFYFVVVGENLLGPITHGIHHDVLLEVTASTWTVLGFSKYAPQKGCDGSRIIPMPLVLLDRKAKSNRSLQLLLALLSPWGLERRGVLFSLMHLEPFR